MYPSLLLSKRSVRPNGVRITNLPDDLFRTLQQSSQLFQAVPQLRALIWYVWDFGRISEVRNTSLRPPVCVCVRVCLLNLGGSIVLSGFGPAEIIRPECSHLSTISVTELTPDVLWDILVTRLTHAHSHSHTPPFSMSSSVKQLCL